MKRKRNKESSHRINTQKGINHVLMFFTLIYTRFHLIENESIHILSDYRDYYAKYSLIFFHYSEKN
jgi:hypothetical protein